MKTKNTTYQLACLLLLLLSCTEVPENAVGTNSLPAIWPDYTGITIPANIAPLNFRNENQEAETTVAVFRFQNDSIVVSGKQTIDIPQSKWKKIVAQAVGSNLEITLYDRQKGQWRQYAPFQIDIADSIDDYLVYRLIEPGYELWNKMGIYQRNLTNFEQKTVYENTLTSNNCVNCHSFCNRDPKTMMFHMRQTFPGTYLIQGGETEKLETKTDQTVSTLVYPSWHSSGRYIAFSVNQTKQAFHSRSKNRIEVFDEASDVVVYDVIKHEIITDSLLFSKKAFETFPTFSPDGKRLYFCTADSGPMPDQYDSLKYSLCSIAFDPDKRTFGNTVDTLYNAQEKGKSVSFPRVSPDGKRILYTLSGYGNFSVWHKDADLWMTDLNTRRNYPLAEANSNDVESYHSWSSNSRWIVFSSRREDGLYTRPYLAYIDEQGEVGKPFLLPQKRSDYYFTLMKSYNIPELVTGPVDLNLYQVSQTAKKDSGIQVRFVAPPVH